jgi:hypothetical protein
MTSRKKAAGASLALLASPLKPTAGAQACGMAAVVGDTVEGS